MFSTPSKLNSICCISIFLLGFSKWAATGQSYRDQAIRDVNARLSQALLQDSTLDHLLVYLQEYVDEDDETVRYYGTFFLSLSDIELDPECILHIDIRGQDRFRGKIRKHSIFHRRKELDEVPETVEAIEYKANVSLLPSEKLSWSTKHAMPSFLNAHSTCEKSEGCAIDWLTIESHTRSISLTYFDDSFLVSNKVVSSMDIPAGSALQAQISAGLRDARKICAARE